MYVVKDVKHKIYMWKKDHERNHQKKKKTQSMN